VRHGFVPAALFVVASAGSWLACSPAPEGDVGPSHAVADPLSTDAATSVSSYFKTTFGLGISNVYWGDMHTHTYYSQDAALKQGLGNYPDTVTPATVYAAARSRGFSFSAVADHAEAPVPANITDGSANVWESTRAASRAANDEIADSNGVFIPFMGFEYTDPFPCTDDTPGDGKNECPGACSYLGENQSCSAYGHKNVVFRGIEATAAGVVPVGAPTKRLSYLDPASWTTPSSECASTSGLPYCGFDTYSVFAPSNTSLWSWLRTKEYAPSGRAADALTIIHTPGNIHHNDWSTTDASFVRNVEVFSQWGNSEGEPPASCSNQSDLDVSIPASEAANAESSLVRPQLVDHWLKKGQESYALSFVGGGDDHAGAPGGDGNGNGGVTGVVTTSASRNGFYDALWYRHTVAATYYGSTGPAALLFAAATNGQNLLGGDLGTIGADGAVTVRVQASSNVTEVQLVVDGCTTRTLRGPVQTIALTGLATKARHFIYVRARRPTSAADGVGGDSPTTAYDQTWSSPVYLRSRT
jgi:hypothetical protein